jgi:hypothetical protein
MKAWEIAEKIIAGNDPHPLLNNLPPDHEFWIGASYSVDPFVGVIYRLPIRDPHRFQGGLTPEMFDYVVKSILNGDLKGDRLAMAIEKLSQACTEASWTRWYRPILQGTLDLHMPLALFNKYAPVGIAPPALSKPKVLTPKNIEGLTGEFFLQPACEDRTFWLLDSTTTLIDVRGYDENIRRVHDPQIEANLIELGRTKPVDLVIIGYLGESFVIDDLVTRDQFTRETCVFPLRQRLEAADRLGLPLVQRSNVLTEFTGEFSAELGLLFEQRYTGALLRDLNGLYPFRVQCDWKLSAKTWSKEISVPVVT